MISFIVCNFNNIKFIEKCINSILEISNIEYEIICVDDCSTDSSQKMISQKFCRNSKIKIVFLNQNVGTFNARKIGVQNCNGDYIYFVDSDDWISSNFFNKSLFYFLYKKHKDIYFSKIFLNRHLNLYFIPNEYTFDPPKNYYSIEELLINFFLLNMVRIDGVHMEVLVKYLKHLLQKMYMNKLEILIKNYVLQKTYCLLLFI